MTNTKNVSRPMAIVTGAGSGIGRTTAVMLSKAGYDLVLMGRRPGPLAETARLVTHGSEHMIAACDVGDAREVRKVVGAAFERFGRVDVLVNNAGYAPLLPIEKTTPEIVDEVFRVNALGPAYLIHEVWPRMVEARRGCIVNISTMGTKDPYAGFFAYASAKASVNLMARSCADEGKRFNIRAFAVAPGAVETGMLRSIFPESQLPRSAAMEPEQVARLVLDCVEGKYDKRVGETIYISKSTGIV